MSGHQRPKRTFIENEELALAHDRSCQCKDLALADGEVTTTARDLGVERDASLVGLALQREQTRGTQRVVKNGIVVQRERIEVLTERAAE